MGKITMNRTEAGSDYYPPECMVCAERQATNRIHQNLIYYPPWVYIGLLGGIIPLAILMYALKKEEVVNLHLCDECYGKYKTLTPMGCGVGFLCFLLFVGIIWAFAVEQNAVGLLGILILIGIPIYYLIAHHMKYSISCTHMDDNSITIKIPSNRYPEIFYQYREATPNYPPFYCPDCNHQNPAESKFCSKCGSEI
ncbi:MAG: zinc ribbon domain-containing protein [Candidatus Eremiobacteraeota bacterium]|nr:zinc ribbon domain-containing protein [Candidatus Eremiobacteraeota bacterium]